MKYIIDVPDKMVINSPLKGQILGLPVWVSETQQEILLPTNISLKPYNDACDGCFGCKYNDTEEWEEPCRRCKNSYMLMWRAKE